MRSVSREYGGLWPSRFAEKVERTAQAWGNEVRTGFGGSGATRALEQYREATVRRLEQREFRDFLENLRHATDRAKFD
jgi:hypothetical protein